MRCRACGENNPGERVECANCGEPLLDALSETGITEPREPEKPTEVGSKTVTDEAGGEHGETAATPSPGAPAPTRAIAAVPTRSMEPDATGSILPGRSPSAGGITGGSSTGELELGTVFGSRYEIISILGQGGMGRVYKARDRELDKLIALKTIRLDTAAGPEALRRFKQELLLARKVTHKNVVRIFDLGEADGAKFFTMEYVEGESLKALMRRKGKLPPAEAVALSRQILSALGEAHAQGIVHRDLKPQNVMVEPSGKALLMDFGIARATDVSGMTETGTVIGTPDYMSPEQVRGEKVGPASDVFAFGVILYEMLTGELPFQAESAVSKVMMRLTHQPRPVREVTPGIPKYLETVVRRCLEIDTGLRYAGAAEVLADLDREQASRSLTLRFQRAVSRKRRVIAGAAVAAVAIGALAWWAALRSAPGPEPTAAAPTEPVHTVAILPFTNATGSEELEWMRTGLPEMLVTDLAQSRYVRPVPGERVLSVLYELGAEEQTRFDEATLESISTRAPAQSVLHGQFVESGGQLRLDMTLRKAGSGVPLPLKAEAATTDVFALVDQLSQDLKAHLDLSPEQIRDDTVRPFSEVATASLEALRAYHNGVFALEERTFQTAIPELREATKQDPNFAMAWARLAEAYLGSGDQREAEAAADRARTLSEQAPLPTAQRYQIHSIVAEVQDDLETAATSYQELARLYPQDPDIQYSLANTLRRLGDQPEAIAAFQRVLELDPGFGAAEIDLAGTYWAAGRYDEALRTLQATLAADRFEGEPEALGTVHSLMGVCYRETGDLDKSLEHLGLSLQYREEAGDKRGQATTLTNIASVHEYRGEISEALAAERKALRIARQMRDRPRESYILNNIGLTYLAAGRLEDALEAFRETMSIELEREDYDELANRLDNIAEVYLMMGRHDDALIYLERARSHLEKTEALEEKGANLHFIGRVRKEQGAYDEALEALLAALPILQEINELDGAAGIHFDLAGIYQRQGRYADAWTSLQTSLKSFQEAGAEHHLAEIQGGLGHLLVSVGRFSEAEAMLAEAAHGADHHQSGSVEPEILLGQGRLRVARRQRQAAIPLLEEAIEQARRRQLRVPELEARIALGEIRRDLGEIGEAVALLRGAREDAGKARLRTLEAEAFAALGRTHVARQQPEEARRAALDAISLADKYAGRPTLVEARTVLALALEDLDRQAEALDAWARAAAELEWIRGSLRPEDVPSYMSRPDVQSFLAEALPRLDRAGRQAEAAPLRQFQTTAASS